MLTAVVVALAWLGSHNTIQKTDHRVADWTVTLRADRFTGAVSCQARRGHVSLQGPAAVFSFGPAVDTTEAVYRINQGPPHAAKEVAFRLRTLGTPMTREPLDNPSRGEVTLPLADVVDADYVWIRIEAKQPPRRFPITGIKQVLAYESSACTQN
jgi:hypothetical protein